MAATRSASCPDYRYLTKEKSRSQCAFVLKGLCIGLAAMLFLTVTSCRRSAGTERVVLPPTPVLSIQSTWAVVKSPLLRVREEPTSQSTVLSHIRLGAVVEVLTKSDKQDTVEQESDFWYRINYQGLKGWVFGVYIEKFDSRSKADKFAATLQ